LEANITIPSAAEVCVLDHIRAVASIPHDAQEALSSDHTPTLSYSLPFYFSVIEDWEDQKALFPLLAPIIDIGIRKIKEYIGKSTLSQMYLLAIC
jgi:hypothetical protein